MSKKWWDSERLKNIHVKDLKKDQLLIVLLVGILLLVITIPAGKPKDSDKDDMEKNYGSQDISGSDITEREYVKYLESHLEELFSQMEGVGETTVMVTLASSAEKVVEKDVERQGEAMTESDSQGGERTTNNSSVRETTVYEGAETKEGTPYVSMEITPRVEGVVVIASGGEDPHVVKNITEAVQALFGIDTHKIRIVKKN